MYMQYDHAPPPADPGSVNSDKSSGTSGKLMGDQTQIDKRQLGEDTAAAAATR